jgi:hypothetical protein
MTNIETQLREAARMSGLSMKRLADDSGLCYASVHGFLTDDSRTLTLTGAAKLAVILGLELKPSGRKRKAGKR